MKALLVLLVTVRLAAAGSPPTVAIFVAPKDPSATKIAAALTADLRKAAAKPKTYRAKGTAKEIDAALLAADCLLGQATCAAAVGEKLGVDYMLAGEVELKGGHAVVTLGVVNVQSKQRVRSLRDVTGAKSDTAKWARTLYTRIADDATGELVITANARRGQVLIDGQPVTELYEGHATVTDLALGAHELAIRAAGYHDFDVDVTVDGRTQEAVLLDPL